MSAVAALSEVYVGYLVNHPSTSPISLRISTVSPSLDLGDLYWLLLGICHSLWQLPALALHYWFGLEEKATVYDRVWTITRLMSLPYSHTFQWISSSVSTPLSSIFYACKVIKQTKPQKFAWYGISPKFGQKPYRSASQSQSMSPRSSMSRGQTKTSCDVTHTHTKWQAVHASRVQAQIQWHHVKPKLLPSYTSFMWAALFTRCKPS